MIKLNEQKSLLEQIKIRISNCKNKQQKKQLIKHYQREKREYNQALRYLKGAGA